MTVIYQLPVNLSRLSVERKTLEGIADLETIWLTPYPVITNYLKLCRKLGLAPFGGGDILNQGKRVDGFITSGYRSVIMNGNKNSPHLYGFAIDLIAIGIERQIEICREAITSGLFTRCGLYPDREFIHLDQAPLNWIQHYNKAWYWVKRSDGHGYKFFSEQQLEEALSEAA